MLKYLFIKYFKWIEDVKRHTVVRKYRSSNNKYSSSSTYRSERKKTIASILILFASIILSLASFLSRKRVDSLIDTLFIFAIVLQLISMVVLISTLLYKGGERCIHRFFLFYSVDRLKVSPVNTPPRID